MSSFPFYSYGLNDQPDAPTVQMYACGAPKIINNVGAERLKGTYGTYTDNYPYQLLTSDQMGQITQSLKLAHTQKSLASQNIFNCSPYF